MCRDVLFFAANDKDTRTIQSLNFFLTVHKYRPIERKACSEMKGSSPFQKDIQICSNQILISIFCPQHEAPAGHDRHVFQRLPGGFRCSRHGRPFLADGRGRRWSKITKYNVVISFLLYCEIYVQWVPQMKTRGVWNIHAYGVTVRGIH
jgi:hypothetical protein